MFCRYYSKSIPRLSETFAVSTLLAAEMSHFDERSGIVSVETPWGKWWQTISEIYIEVNVKEGTRGKDVNVEFKPSTLRVDVCGETVIKGDLFSIIKPDDSIWTIEDKKMIRICLCKGREVAANLWKSLLKNQYEANILEQDNMQKKLTLQRYQLENPGFDFSSADISGNYQEGGPQLPSYND
ncbi:DgyrCDS1728 [Dimorphilus gyrociliatus]|uniref:DgyrCDS1728 n=1 Tax=Dimorphilus gyrociliatus TaxID=2664684 RepID=A0A7I8VB16_9ANNE|nr:DgyrCDS1728 [Dimorphilus gyrociliatus]